MLCWNGMNAERKVKADKGRTNWDCRGHGSDRVKQVNRDALIEKATLEQNTKRSEGAPLRMAGRSFLRKGGTWSKALGQESSQSPWNHLEVHTAGAQGAKLRGGERDAESCLGTRLLYRV